MPKELQVPDVRGTDTRQSKDDPMTPEERAEKIVSAIYDYERDDGTHAVELVAAQIREAMEEAYEDAAKLLQPYMDDCGDDCLGQAQEDIRARAKEVKG
jgi:hypothetical protein